jgi:single-stranded-DNA-specific exonuclease
LPDVRPPVVAIINPRYLTNEHPLFHLSGVAVAYKLMEALYETLPEIPLHPLEDLLDLVAIGLVADLVQLTGDCRYLAQKGIEVLRQKKRLGVRLLLEQCKRVGDRPIDIRFGIAPRINAVSRIWGDVRKCVELLTTSDEKVGKSLIEQTELANTQRKALQKKVFKQVQAKIDQIDLSTTGIIVLVDPQWSVGGLGLVAGQVVGEYGRPTILCTLEDGIAKGSARSLEGINPYELLKGQEHLLTSFGGHPLAGGLSFPIENLQVLVEAIDQKFWSQYGQLQSKALKIDLEVTIADLNKDLFNELRQLEPFGMGNPYPKLLVRDCRFSGVSNANIRNQKGQKVEYIKTEFTLSDRLGNQIYGDWWGHYSYELPDSTCDVVIELVDNAFRRRYDARLLDFKVQSPSLIPELPSLASTANKGANLANIKILDLRGSNQSELLPSAIICDRCPQNWHDFNTLIDRAHQDQQSLALVYPNPDNINGAIAWQTLVGIAKYLITKLGIEDQKVLQIGFEVLQQYGYLVSLVNDESDDSDQKVRISSISSTDNPSSTAQQFIKAANEIIFQQQFFDRQFSISP